MYEFIAAVQQTSNQLRYILLFVVKVINELNVSRMASATLFGCTSGERCPPFATRWIEAVLPLNACLWMSSLIGVGLTAKSAMLKIELESAASTHM